MKNLIYFVTLSSALLLLYLGKTGELGEFALYFLTLAIFARPLASVFPRFGFLRYLVVYRRQIGVSSALFAFAHAASVVANVGGLDTLLKFALMGGIRGFMFWGLISLCLITPMFLTSNNFSVSLLKRHWKTIHLLIHPLYISVLIHRGLQEGMVGFVQMAIILVGLYCLRLMAKLKITL